MPEKQAQADLLRYYKHLVRDAHYKCHMYHVFGHLDKLLPLAELKPEELANIKCDKGADIALIEGVRSGVYIDRVLPDEDMVVQVEGVKMSGPTCRPLIVTGAGWRLVSTITIKVHCIVLFLMRLIGTALSV
jgi:hypothetical protein